MSNVAKKAQEDLWRPKTHFIVDEISMVSKSMLATIERRLSVARSGTQATNTSEAFGGLNVIFFGNFHQFPPVAGTALYTRRYAGEEENCAFGGMIYEQFSTVVILTEQVRVTDPVWREILGRVRHGACTREQLRFLHSMVLSHPDCPKTDLASPPWCDAVLITPRHGVRIRWNTMALEQHAFRSGQRVFVSVAEDTIKGQSLTLRQRLAVHEKPGNGRSSRSGGKQDRAGLPLNVELAVGMKVMVTFNVNTDLDLTNGARGSVHDIIFHADEDGNWEGMRQVLRHPPACVLVKLDRTKAPRLHGLEEGVIPSFQCPKRFR